MKRYRKTINPIQNLKALNRIKYEMALHGCTKGQKPSYRYVVEQVGAEELGELCLMGHIISGQLADELVGDDKHRIRLRILTEIMTEDLNLAKEGAHYLEEEYRTALEDLLDLYERSKVEYVWGAAENTVLYKYNLTIIAEYELLDS